MNFIDLLVACWRLIKRFFCWLGSLCAGMIRISWRKWYIVLPMLIIGFAFSIFITQEKYREYEVDGVLVLNGPTAFEVEQSIQPLERALPEYLSENQNLDKMLGISPEAAACLSHFQCFPVIDTKHDSLADNIDYKGKVDRADTTNVVMPGRLALRFRTRRLPLVPEVQEGLLRYLNANPQHVAAYEAKKADIDREALFCERQINLLDSFTTEFYFHQGTGEEAQMNMWREGSVLGRREIVPLHYSVFDLIKKQKTVDHERSLMTAPVVVETAFVANPRPVWRRSLVCPALTLLFWILGMLIALVVERRKALSAWLNKRD